MRVTDLSWLRLGLSPAAPLLQNDMDASKLCSRRSPLPQLPTLSPPHTVSEDLNMTNPVWHGRAPVSLSECFVRS